MKGKWNPSRSISNMTLEERISQLFMLGFDGNKMEEGLKELLEELKPGGIIIFSRNVASDKQLRELLAEAHEFYFKLTGTPLLISIDQEGGLVARIRKNFAVFPGNMALGATYSTEKAYFVGKAIGEQLKWFRININLAPVIDIIVDKTNPSIGVRSFGDDPYLVSKLGRAMILGFKDSEIISVAKHFPGIGAASIDPHMDLPVLEFPLKVIRSREFLPFIEAIEAGVDAIMPSHVLVSEIDEDLPASLSKKMIEGTLRGELGFKGAILSDDLLMGAVSNRYSLEEASFLALTAGEDMVLICRDFEGQRSSIDFVVSAVKKGNLSKERVFESLQRVMNLKLRALHVKPMDNPKLEQFFVLEREVCKESLTLIKFEEKCLPIRGIPSKITIICPERIKKLVNAGFSSSTLGEKIASRGIKVKEIFFEEERADKVLKEAIEELSDSEMVIIFTREILRYPKEANLVRELIKFSNRKGIYLVAVSVGTPFDIEAFPEVKNYLAMYDYHEAMQETFVDVLFGRVKPEGKLPVSIQGLFQRGFGIIPEVWKNEG